MEDVMPYDKKIKEGTIVLFNTNWYKKEGTEEFFEHPYVSVEVAGLPTKSQMKKIRWKM
jgi:kynurenine formamidase